MNCLALTFNCPITFFFSKLLPREGNASSSSTLDHVSISPFFCFAFYFFYYSMNFIMFIVVQWSSQPNFIAFPSQNPSTFRPQPVSFGNPKLFKSSNFRFFPGGGSTAWSVIREAWSRCQEIGLPSWLSHGSQGWQRGDRVCSIHPTDVETEAWGAEGMHLLTSLFLDQALKRPDFFFFFKGCTCSIWKFPD